MHPSARLPESVSKWIDPFLVCAIIVAVYCTSSRLQVSNLILSVCIVAAVIAIMVSLEWWRAPKHAFRYSVRESLPQAVIAWIGTLAGLAMLIGVWSTLAEYQRAYYRPFFNILPFILTLAPLISAVFILAACRVLGPSVQGGYQLGLVVLGRFRDVKWYLVRDEVIVWLIRGFFLPINFCELVWTIGLFRGRELSLLNGPWGMSEYYILLMIYAVILAAIIPGYLFGSRLIRTETTAVSHSWFDWMVTLACYLPFSTAVMMNWFNYSPNVPRFLPWLQPWVVNLQNIPVLFVTVGGIIIVLWLVHLWSEAQFGLRSSNLSNRGIITTGPYRFCKHPIYASKCVVWLLIWMPFVSGVNLLDDIRLTVLWMCVSGIYLFRALAEERLLSADPAYVAYALWIDKHGMFSKLSTLVPQLSYAWRLNIWQKSKKIEV